MMPSVLPPKPGGMPSGCPSPTATSALISPGDLSAPSESGSAPTTASPPASCTASANPPMSLSSVPKNVGLSMYAPAMPAPSASCRLNASRSTVPSSGE